MRCGVIALIVGAAFVPLLSAQESTAGLLGTITDPSGAVIPGTNVTAHNVATGLDYKAVANATGDYSILSLPIGSYTVTAAASGFKTSTVTGLTLQVNQQARVDIKLAVGAATESIEVQGTAPVMVTDASSVGQVVENASIENMPVNGRQFWELAQLTPGAIYTPSNADVASGGTAIRASRITLRISGTGRIWGGWYLDGFDITEYELGSSSITPSTDALAEFKVMDGGMPAEYGLPFIINAALKSGSNNFHGTAYEYLRNTDIQARNFFSPTVPQLNRNEFGGTLGGPIRRNRLFIFGDYEGDRTRQGTTIVSTVPTAQQLSGNFAGMRPIYDPLTTAVNPANSSQYIRTQFPGNVIPANRISPQAQFFHSWWPTPNDGPTLYVTSPSEAVNTDKFDIKVSPRLTEKDSLVSRYSFVNNTENDVQGIPALGFYPLHSRAQNAGLSYVHIFSPTLTSEVTYSYYRMFFLLLNASNFNGQDVISQAGITGFDGLSNQQPAAPDLIFSGYATLAGSTDNRPKANRIRTYEYRSSLSWIHGNHIAKFGAELAHQAHAFLKGNASQGEFGFNGQYTQNPLSTGNTGDSTADFLLGEPYYGKRAGALGIAGDTGSDWYLYAQDDYRVTHNLTLNLGLRWELNSFMNGVRGQTNAFDFATGKVIIPSQNGLPDMTAQAGEAQAWAVFQPLLETTEQERLPWSVRPPDYRCPAPRIGFAWRPFNSDKTVVRSAYGLFYIFIDTNILQAEDRVPPFSVIQQINNDVPTLATLTPSRTLGNFWLGQPLVSITSDPAITTGMIHNRMSYAQNWNFNLQHEFPHGLAAEVAYVGNKGTRLVYGANGNVPLPGPGNVQARRPYPNWGQFLFQPWAGGSTYQSLQAKIEKRFSHGFSILGSYTFSKCLNWPGTEEGASPASYLDNQNIGLCSFDAKHNLVASYIWELPFGKGRKFFSAVSRPLDLLIGGWQWQGINTIQTGLPYTVAISTDTANTGVTGERPNAIAPAVQPQTLNCWFFTSANPACHALLPNQGDTFALPAQYTYGNNGLNTLREGRLVDLDMALFKSFKITEFKTLELRAQAYNLTNTPSFSVPSTNWNLATGGQVTSTRDQPRLFEFALKFSF